MKTSGAISGRIGGRESTRGRRYGQRVIHQGRLVMRSEVVGIFILRVRWLESSDWKFVYDGFFSRIELKWEYVVIFAGVEFMKNNNMMWNKFLI